MITVVFLAKIYFISPLRAFFLWLVSSISTGIIIFIIFAVIGFSFLFSLFNSFNTSNINLPNTTQQEVVPTSDQTVTSPIKIITPAVGETYNPGQIITITWTPGTPGITYINFYKSDNTYSTMATPQNIPDTSGSMQYPFPVNMPTGQYKIYAFYKDKNNIDTKAYESSGYFNIVSSTPKTVPVTTTAPTATNTAKSEVNKIFTAYMQELSKTKNFTEMIAVMNKYKSKEAISDLNSDISDVSFTEGQSKLMFSMYKSLAQHFYAISKTEITGSSAIVEASVCEEIGCSNPEKIGPGNVIKMELILENGVWKINL